MRLFPVIFVILFISCQTSQNQQKGSDTLNQAQAKEVEAVLTSFFEGISNYDYQALREITAEDYVLIENGPIWNVDSLINVVQQFERETTISYELTEMETTVEDDMAWMTYKNYGHFKMPDGERNFDWTESAVFRKQGDEWKMVLLHSTMN